MMKKILPKKTILPTKCCVESNDGDAFFDELAKSCDEAPDEQYRKGSLIEELRLLLEQLFVANRAAATVNGKLFGGEADDRKEEGSSRVDDLIYDCRVEAAELVKQLTNIHNRI